MNSTYLSEPLWFADEVNKTEHLKRITNVIDIKQYLLRLHEVLQRKDCVRQVKMLAKGPQKG